MPSNPIDNESPTPTFATRNLSFPHITALPRTALFILRPPIQPNIKPHSRTFSIAHRVLRKRQRPPSSRVIESPRHSTFGVASTWLASDFRSTLATSGELGFLAGWRLNGYLLKFRAPFGSVRYRPW